MLINFLNQNILVNLSENVKLVFFVVIIVANAFFFLLWMIKMYFEINAMMVKKMQKAYLILCVCFNK
jgi:hypothetical protein